MLMHFISSLCESDSFLGYILELRLIGRGLFMVPRAKGRA